MTNEPQKKKEQSRQMGINEAEAEADAIAKVRVSAGRLKQNIRGDDHDDHGIFREERRQAGGDDTVKHTGDPRVPNLPDYAGEEPKELKHPGRNPNTQKPDPQLLEDAYSKNDPGVKTKE